MNIQKLIKQAIDLHVHVGPEIVPRRYTVASLQKEEEGNLKAIGVKNHYFPTIAMRPKENSDLKVIYSVVLNNYVGGFNPAIIRASAQLSKDPILVWFPTIHASNFLKTQKWEVAKEWLDETTAKSFEGTLASDIEGLTVLDKKGNIKKEVVEVLKTIKKYNCVLLTGHISWQESEKLITFASQEMGIQKIIVTHPIYQHINMPINIQKELVTFGALIEHSYSMYSIDKIPIENIVKEIQAVGPKNCIATSDVGQTYSESPSKSLADFAKKLNENGVSENDIYLMMVDNPARIVENVNG